jgi:hypothetical protein
MSISNTLSPSGEQVKVKQPWVAPSIQVLDMKEARSGTKLNGTDGLSRS